MTGSGRPLVWLHGKIRTPPLSLAARLAIVLVDVFAKKTQSTPAQVIQAAKDRLRVYDSL